MQKCFAEHRWKVLGVFRCLSKQESFASSPKEEYISFCLISPNPILSSELASGSISRKSKVRNLKTIIKNNIIKLEGHLSFNASTVDINFPILLYVLYDQIYLFIVLPIFIIREYQIKRLNQVYHQQVKYRQLLQLLFTLFSINPSIRSSVCLNRLRIYPL